MNVLENELEDLEDPSPLQRSMKKKKSINKYKNWNYSSIAYCYIFTVVDQQEHVLYDEVKGIGVLEDAMKEEISTLKKNKTWNLAYLLSDVSSISCK